MQYKLYDHLTFEELKKYIEYCKMKYIINRFYSVDQLDYIENILGIRVLEPGFGSLQDEIENNVHHRLKLGEFNKELFKNAITNYDLIKPEILEEYIFHWKNTLKRAINAII